ALGIISMISGIIIALIGVFSKTRYEDKKAAKQPKDRMEQMFDGYERLIKQKDKEDDRKQKYITAIESELQATKEHVVKLEEALEATQGELEVSRTENRELKNMLDE